MAPAAVIDWLFGCAIAIMLQAEAHNVINTVASAAEGYPFVPPSWLPNILVPFTAWIIPGFVMASLFVYIVSGSCVALGWQHGSVQQTAAPAGASWQQQSGQKQQTQHSCPGDQGSECAPEAVC
jgi:hypothetical protein